MTSPDIVTTSLPLALLETNVPAAPEINNDPPMFIFNRASFEKSIISTPFIEKVSVTAKKLISTLLVTVKVFVVAINEFA